MNQIIVFFNENRDNLEYIENYDTKDFAFKRHLLNLSDMYKAGVDISKKSPLPDSPGDRVSQPSTQTTPDSPGDRVSQPSTQTTILSL